MIGFAWQKPNYIFIVHPLGSHSPHYFYDVDSSFPPVFPPLNSLFLLHPPCCHVHRSSASSPVSTFPCSCFRLLCHSQIWYSFKGKIHHEKKGYSDVVMYGLDINKYASKLETCRYDCLGDGDSLFIELVAESCGLLYKCNQTECTQPRYW